MNAVQMTKTLVTIDGETKPINFRNLNLDEKMLDVNHFSFSWTPEGQSFSGPSAVTGAPFGGMVDEPKRMATMAKFKKEHLSKKVNIKLVDEGGNENHSFSGIIIHIGASFNDHGHAEVDYQISGTGLYSKMNGKIECNSFVDKSLSDIVTAVNNTGIPWDASGIYEKHLPYIVQYNLTGFEFIKTLAIRFGQWMYYNGSNLVFGKKPSTADPIKMIVGKDIENLNIDSHITDPSNNATGFDPKKGKPIANSTNVKAPTTSDLLSATADGGEGVYENNGTGTFYPFGQTEDELALHNKLQQQAAHASSVFLNGSSKNSKITVGTTISVDDSEDSPGTTFIIVDIHHSANNNHGYSNHFTAIAADAEVPHYTNPWMFTQAKKQMAVVVENEEPDGFGGIKVHFPWMKANETTPWIQAITTSGGKDQGFRWLPEKEEEVVIDFHGHNVEYPLMAGALHTEQNKSGVDEKGNNIKMIGTKTGRRLEIDDDKGVIRMTDNFLRKWPKNSLAFHNDSSMNEIGLGNFSDEKNFGGIRISKGEFLEIVIMSDNEPIVGIQMEKNGKKIIIHSEGDIEISAKENIKMDAKNISITASHELKLEGTQSVKIKGTQVEANADSTMEINGASTTIKGNAKVEVSGKLASLKGDTITTIKGTPVMIN